MNTIGVVSPTNDPTVFFVTVEKLIPGPLKPLTSIPVVLIVSPL